MGYHTDQSLDLQEDSFICIFSCYKNVTVPSDLRKLQVKNKSTKKSFDIKLENNSIILFSTSDNKKHLHKIALDCKKSTNEWLGITFRLSKTLIKFMDNIPYIFPDNKILRIANNSERNEFVKHKRNENVLKNMLSRNCLYH